jgi:hypothetical protein
VFVCPHPQTPAARSAHHHQSLHHAAAFDGRNESRLAIGLTRSLGKGTTTTLLTHPANTHPRRRHGGFLIKARQMPPSRRDIPVPKWTARYRDNCRSDRTRDCRDERAGSGAHWTAT